MPSTCRTLIGLIVLTTVLSGARVLAGTDWQASLDRGEEALLTTDFAGAEALFRQALHEAESLAAAEAIHSRIATGLAVSLIRLERSDEVMPLFDSGVRVWAGATAPDQCLIAGVLNEAAHRLHQGSMAPAGDRNDARRASMLLRAALEVRERIAGPESLEVGRVIAALQASLMGHGGFDERVALARRHVEIYEKHHGADHPELVIPLAELADLVPNKHEAGRIYERIYKLFDKHYAENPRQMAQVYRLLEAHHRSLGDPETVARWAAKAREAEQASMSNAELESPNTLIHRAIQAKRDGDMPTGDTLLLRAVEATRTLRALDPEDPNIFYVLNHAGHWEQSRNRFDEAEDYLLEALDLATLVAGEDPQHLHSTLSGLSHFEVRRGDLAQALDYRLRALEIGGVPDIRMADLTALTDLYGKMGRHEDALESGKRTLVLFEEAYGPDHLLTTNATMRLADTYLALGNDAEAEVYLLRTIKIFEHTGQAGNPLLELYRSRYNHLKQRLGP